MSPTVADLIRSATVLHSITLQQPWGTMVAECGKDVENRLWTPPEAAAGHALAIHAGLVYDEGSAQSIREGLGLKVPGRHSCPRGAVVAVAVLGGWVRNSPSRWAKRGQWHWQLQGTVRLAQPVPCKGDKGLWQLPAEVLFEVREQVLQGESRAQALAALSPTEGPPTGFEQALAEAVTATRPSHRAWSKGSARGAGAAQSHGTVYVGRSQAEPCCWCGAWFHATPGGGPHAPVLARHRGEGWPYCEHGEKFLEEWCTEFPVAPRCCAPEWRAACGPFLTEWVAAQAVAP